MDISTFTINHVKEKDGRWRYWFNFSVNNINYELFLLRQKEEKKYFVVHIAHDDTSCPFCGDDFSENTVCESLQEKKLELFHRVIKSSKNRLRWVTKFVD